MTDAERDEAIRLLARVVEALVQDVWTCDPVWVATIDLGRDVLKQLADLATETVAVKPKRRKSFETLVLFHLVKTAVGCQVCGERDPVVIDFHHVDPATKSFGLNARGTRTHVNEQRIVDELKKCVCLCANCHRRHHNGGLDVTGLALIDEATILQAITRMLSHATP